MAKRRLLKHSHIAHGADRNRIHRVTRKGSVAGWVEANPQVWFKFLSGGASQEFLLGFLKSEVGNYVSNQDLEAEAEHWHPKLGSQGKVWERRN